MSLSACFALPIQSNLYPALNAALAGDGSDVKRGELGTLRRLRRLAVRGRRHLAARQWALLHLS